MSEVIGWPDGNVKIVLTRRRQFRLHLKVLARASPKLAKLLDPSYAAKLSTAAKEKGVKIRYRLMLINNPNSDDEEEVLNYVLEPVQLNGNAKPLHPRPVGAGLGAQDAEFEPLMDAFQSVFGVFYNQPINLGNFQEGGLASMLAKAIYVVDVADYLECISLVTAPIESALLATGQPFFVSIASNPSLWLRFGERLRSRIIFKEALIHAAGKYHTRSMQQSLPTLSDELRELVAVKATAIKKAVMLAERQIIDFYPAPLKRYKVAGLGEKDDIGRASYSNDILFWMALTAFRHFVTGCALDGETHDAADMGYSFMAAVRKAGTAYMTRQQLLSFHEQFPMSGKAMATVLFRVNEIKEQVKQYAEVSGEKKRIPQERKEDEEICRVLGKNMQK